MSPAETDVAVNAALQPSQVTVVVIAKSPVPGRVKTRLCPPCTPDQAADIAMAAVQDTLEAVATSAARRTTVALDGAPGSWIPSTFDVITQRGDGLDERLAAVVADVDGPVLIIGMDTPQVTPTLIDETVLALCAAGTDAVLGMADDGGYWVIGLREPRPDALLGVPMSTDTTGAEQLARLTELGLRTTFVVPLCDVDTFDEAVQVAGLIPHSRFVVRVAAVIAAVHRTTVSEAGADEQQTGARRG